MAASRSSTSSLPTISGSQDSRPPAARGGRGRYLGAYLLFLDETVAVFSESERRDPPCATGRNPGPRVRSSDVHPQEPYICNGEEDRREDDQRREIPPDPDCRIFGGRRPCFRPTGTVFGWKFSPGVGIFTFSLTSLYMFAVFFGKRKAGYTLYGSRNWRGSRLEPGVPGLHTRSPSLQGVLTGCPSAGTACMR